ncbi:MAG: endolytic transglycosylase MltG [Butyrivibrio sp.]|jgi:hypothetical protein|nr:endolytic transglycosylase MltG [Butyrivibrio sp.]
MKLKYYLRGLGIGLIIATIVMGIHSGSSSSSPSDAEIRQRAEALGMIDGAMLSDQADGGNAGESHKDDASSAQTVDTAGKEVSEENNKGQSVSAASASEMASETQTQSGASESASESSAVSAAGEDRSQVVSTGKTAESTASEEPSETKVVIPGGAGSDSVCSTLESAGVIDSGNTFNRYLIDRGLDRKIKSGTKTIPAGATYEDIASIITR